MAEGVSMAEVESILALKSNCAYCAARPLGLCGALGDGEAFGELREARLEQVTLTRRDRHREPECDEQDAAA